MTFSLEEKHIFRGNFSGGWVKPWIFAGFESGEIFAEQRRGSAEVQCCSCVCWWGARSCPALPETSLEHPEALLAPRAPTVPTYPVLPVPCPWWGSSTRFEEGERHLLWDKQTIFFFNIGFILVSCAQTPGEIPSSYLLSVFLLNCRKREKAKKWQMIANTACPGTCASIIAEKLLVCWALLSGALWTVEIQLKIWFAQ